MKTLLLSLIILAGCDTPAISQINDTLQDNYSVMQCDSLIQANIANPDFVILDVRTANEHIPEHLEGAINRDYYHSNFYQMLNELPRNKIYIIHCLSGARSGNTFTMMQELEFPYFVNMLGGINAWKNALLPVTDQFAPLLMAISETEIGNDTVMIGDIDTLYFSITNRANDTLIFEEINLSDTLEFSTDFEITTTLTGAMDYSFSVFYEPADQNTDSLSFLIESNGGNLEISICRTGLLLVNTAPQISISKLTCYPHPFDQSTNIEYDLHKSGMVSFKIFDHSGKLLEQREEVLTKGQQRIKWDASGTSAGIYFYTIKAGDDIYTGKLLKVR